MTATLQPSARRWPDPETASPRRHGVDPARPAHTARTLIGQAAPHVGAPHPVAIRRTPHREEAMAAIDAPMPKRTAKRVFDVIASLIGLIVLSPVLLVVALLVKADSPGPVIFKQTRVGLNGIDFSILKFRTMGTDAESRVAELQQFNEGAGPLFKMKADPRVTRVGGVLRKLSIDELPQLVNVLRGDMSLVGPRPGLPSEVAAYEPHAYRRLLVLPGITGLWQVSGRSDLGWDAGLELDLAYVDDCGFGRDLVILGRTVPKVLGSSGAY